MNRRLLGVETEYAFTALKRGRSGYAGRRDASNLVRLVPLSFPSISDGGNGFFLANSSRVYVDTGEHPELSCAEVTNPWDAVRYALAGDRIMMRLATEYEKRYPPSEAVVTRVNVDYGSRTTWGMHESYLHQADPDSLPGQLLPFLASRVIFAGGGGFHPFSPGLEFVVSPRAFFLVANVSGRSTASRPLFHTKDETLAGDRYHRLHILGESTCSELATWLKVGTTALVVALIEAGRTPASGFCLRSPVEALHAIAADPTCSVRVPTASGRQVTAIAIQRAYLQAAEDEVGTSFMPAWAGDVCSRWRAVLDALEDGAPESVATSLDWGIKRALFRRRAERRCFTWESLREWTGTLRAVLGILSREGNRPGDVTALLRTVRGRRVSKAVQAQLDLFLRGEPVQPGRLGEFCAMREELLELDARFSQLGDGGVFAAMDGAGVLDHHVAGVEGIENAVAVPPPDTRARLRGEWVRRLSTAEPDRYSCGWTGVMDRKEDRLLDLGDPFATEATWRRARWGPTDGGMFRRSVPTFLRRARLRALYGGRSGESVLHEEWRMVIHRAIAGGAPEDEVMRLFEQAEQDARRRASESDAC